MMRLAGGITADAALRHDRIPEPRGQRLFVHRHNRFPHFFWVAAIIPEWPFPFKRYMLDFVLS